MGIESFILINAQKGERPVVSDPRSGIREPTPEEEREREILERERLDKDKQSEQDETVRDRNDRYSCIM